MSEKVAFSACIDNERVFAFSRALATQDEAIEICEDDFQGTLGPIRSSEDFIDLHDTIFLSEIEPLIDNQNFDTNFLIGLEAPVRPADDQDTTLFRFIDSADDEGLDFFHVDAGLFPWDSLVLNQNQGLDSQPNNLNANQDCAMMRFNSNFGGIESNGLLHDRSCTRGFEGAICRSNCVLDEINVDVGESRFKVVIEEEAAGVVTAVQALNWCAVFDDDFDQSLTLGPVRGEDEFLALTSNLRSNSVLIAHVEAFGSARIALDLRVPIDLIEPRLQNPADTSVFRFLDEDPNALGLDFFHGDAGSFPWGENEPNNLNNDENCINLVFEPSGDDDEVLNFFLEDVSCNQQRSQGFLCRGDREVLDDDEQADVLLAGNALIGFSLTSVFILLFVASVCYGCRLQNSIIKINEQLVVTTLKETGAQGRNFYLQSNLK